MKDGWVAFGLLIAFLAGFFLAMILSVKVDRPNKQFADCVLEQRGTVQECAVKSGRWENGK